MGAKSPCRVKRPSDSGEPILWTDSDRSSNNHKHMPSAQDLQIFVTGIVGRAMGSGKFSAEDILKLTQSAYDAFHAIMGKPELPPQYSAPAAPQPDPYRGAAHAGSIAHEVIAAVGNGVLPEAKPISVWGGDRAYLGWKDKMLDGLPEPEVCWGAWHSHAAEGDARARGILEKAAAADPFKGDPKWHEANKKRISRAKAILALLK